MFEVSKGVGTIASHFDREIAAKRLAAEEVANYGPTTATKCAVFFIDSQATITPIADNSPTDCSNLFHCQEAIVRLLQNNWSVEQVVAKWTRRLTSDSR